jgi:DNA-binding MarR family transcriptional regulator
MQRDPDGEMHARPGHLVRRVHQLHDSLWVARVSKDVTPTQFAVLSVIADRGTCDQTTIAREASLDTSTAGSVIARLVQRGWVRLQPDTVDRRRNVVQLSEEGARLHSTISRSAAAMTDVLMAPLKPSDQNAFVTMLTRLLEDRDDDPDES